jgi:hypothetical protein
MGRIPFDTTGLIIYDSDKVAEFGHWRASDDLKPATLAEGERLAALVRNTNYSVDISDQAARDQVLRANIDVLPNEFIIGSWKWVECLVTKLDLSGYDKLNPIVVAGAGDDITGEADPFEATKPGELIAASFGPHGIYHVAVYAKQHLAEIVAHFGPVGQTIRLYRLTDKNSIAEAKTPADYF